MKGAILVYGGSAKLREIKAETFLKGCDKSDLMTLSILEGKRSLGIEQIRDAVSFVQKKPFAGDLKAIVIPNAEKLTIEAQNALLKTLEEPPAYASIILLTKTVEALLPTVLSRCQKVAVEGAGTREKRVGESHGKSEMDKVIRMSVEEKFAWAQEKAKDEKEEVIDMLEKWVSEEREKLSEKPCKVQRMSTILLNCRLIIEVKEDLEKTNLNCRLALETLALNLS